MSELRTLALITTGGTIAGRADDHTDTTGYRAGALSAGDLLAAVPSIHTLARIVPEALFAIDSKDIGTAHWLSLARRLHTLLADPKIDGIVVTHGTDTMEESAWLLHLLLPATKPVVLTGAMRPATALSADGPMNLHQAVSVAASGVTTGLGVTVVMNGDIHGARSIAKRHTRALDALQSPEGPLGWADPPRLRQRPCATDAGALVLTGSPLAHPKSTLPDVPVVLVAGGSSPGILQSLVNAGAQGLVLALPGHGSLPTHWEPAVRGLAQGGLPIVRASRTGDGPVLPIGESGTCPLLAAQDLGPLKARLLLILCLAQGRLNDFAAIAGGRG